MMLLILVVAPVILWAGEPKFFSFTEGSDVKNFETFDEWYFHTEMRIHRLKDEGFVKYDSRTFPTPYPESPWSSVMRMGKDEVWTFMSDFATYTVTVYYRGRPRTDLRFFTAESIGVGMR